MRAAKAVADGEADALVSAGSTGAALAASLFNIRRAKGIYRPALALPLPMPEHPVTLLDVGANADVRPDHLVQFAFMGAALVTMRQGIARPRVALLSNGTEATRGNELVLEAHALLAERAAQSFGLEFVGNVEGTQVATGAADVIVADGFTGNITLKLIEGVSQRLMTVIRDRATDSTRGKVGGILLRPSLRGLRDELDPEGPGGAYLLGLRKLGVVPHGRFTRVGFANAIRAAAQRGRRGRRGTHVRRHGGRGRAAASPVRRRRYGGRLSDDDPRRRLPRHPRPPRRRARGRSGAHRAGAPGSARTSRPTRSTSTPSCRSSRTATACASPTRRRRRSSPWAKRWTS